MKRIIRLTESDLTRIVKEVLNNKKTMNEGSLKSSEVKNYSVYNHDGWLKSNNGTFMCVKVEAGWPTGTFAQGIKNITTNSDGSAIIYPNEANSLFSSIDMTKDEVKNCLLKLQNGGTYVKNKSGATIKIGSDLVPWCKKQWNN